MSAAKNPGAVGANSFLTSPTGNTSGLPDINEPGETPSVGPFSPDDQFVRVREGSLLPALQPGLNRLVGRPKSSISEALALLKQRSPQALENQMHPDRVRLRKHMQTIQRDESRRIIEGIEFSGEVWLKQKDADKFYMALLMINKMKDLFFYEEFQLLYSTLCDVILDFPYQYEFLWEGICTKDQNGIYDEIEGLHFEYSNGHSVILRISENISDDMLRKFQEMNLTAFKSIKCQEDKPINGIRISGYRVENLNMGDVVVSFESEANRNYFSKISNLKYTLRILNRFTQIKVLAADILLSFVEKGYLDADTIYDYFSVLAELPKDMAHERDKKFARRYMQKIEERGWV